MCEDEGSVGGDVMAESARFGIGGKEEMGCASGSGGRTVDDRVGGGNERDAI